MNKVDNDDYYNIPTGVNVHHNGTVNGTLAIDRRANATFVILTRNSEIDAAIRSVREIEDRFNRNFGYPYVFLNEEPFPEEFKRCVLTLSNDSQTFLVGLLWIETAASPSSHLP